MLNTLPNETAAINASYYQQVDDPKVNGLSTYYYEVEYKELFLGVRSPKKRSLLSVNEHFEGEHNNKRTFFVGLFIQNKYPLSYPS